MKRFTWFGRGVKPLPRLALLTGVLVLPLGACNDILDVEDPDVTTLSNFQDATSLPTIRAAARGEFALAFIGAPGAGSVQDGQILFSGLLGDEWISSGTFPTRVEVDIRNITETNATLGAATRRLYRARSAADLAVELFEELAPNTLGHAEVLNLSSLGFMLFGENYCSGVPFSRLLPSGAFEFGDRETTEQIFERALDRANEAITVAMAAGAGGADQLNLARVLKGRALLNLGRFAEAGAAVADVPTAFTYLAESSANSSRQANGVFTANVLSERYSATNTEGENGLPYRQNFTAGDPRTPQRRTIDRITAAGDTVLDVGFDRVTAQFNQLKYLNRDADVVAAGGLEARLIEAEAALQAGDMGAFLTALNAQRTAQGLKALTDIPADMPDRVNLLFEERGFTLWLTSHRLGDMRRLIRQYGREANMVFPVGTYHKNTQGGVYGNDVVLPVTVDERNNPFDLGLPEGELCIDRNA